jgi:hypothetical protein
MAVGSPRGLEPQSLPLHRAPTARPYRFSALEGESRDGTHTPPRQL